jgi:type I restriction-modification system DNA methylase subunit
MRELLDNESFSDLNYTIEWRDGKVYQGVIDCEPRSFFKNKKQPFTEHINYFFKQIAEYVGDALVNPADQFFFQTLIKNYQLLPDDKVMQSVTSFDVTSYKNPYELNKAIEKWIDDNVGSFDNVMNRTYSTAEKMFIRNYTGYGGLGKFGTLTVGSMFEFFTPHKVIKSMWALAYKYGYSIEKSILETSVGTGEFLQYASPQTRKLAYEINRYSATITKILYPTTEVRLAPFESMFIKDNYTIKGKTDNLEKFDMVIGNCPYGSFDVLDDKASRYLLGMGEKDFTKAGNYIEYFLRRSLDCLKPNGLIVMIVGAELKNGGSMFLDAKESPVKEYMNEHAILLDAYRLPDSTFERTGVTSDILVIQKK